MVRAIGELGVVGELEFEPYNTRVRAFSWIRLDVLGRLKLSGYGESLEGEEMLTVGDETMGGNRRKLIVSELEGDGDGVSFSSLIAIGSINPKSPSTSSDSQLVDPGPLENSEGTGFLRIDCVEIEVR